MPYETIVYAIADAIATITLNRRERLNTIIPPMPDESEAAVNAANSDPAVKVIVVRGAGRSAACLRDAVPVDLRRRSVC